MNSPKRWTKLFRASDRGDDLSSTHVRSCHDVTTINDDKRSSEGRALPSEGHEKTEASSRHLLLATTRKPSSNSNATFMDSSCSMRLSPIPNKETTADAAATSPPEEAVPRDSLETAREAVAAFFRKSKLTSTTATSDPPLPRFDRNEIVVGKFLGRGGFSDVEEIRGFAHVPSKRTILRRADTIVEHESRSFIMKHAIRNGGHCRYAMKRITLPNNIRKSIGAAANNKSTLDDKSYSAILDLHIEAKFLQALVHPNVIKLRALASQQHEYTPNYFLVLDRLFDTLQHRIQKWKKHQQSVRQSVLGKVVKARADRQKQAFLLERLLAAFDLGEAIAYLHQRNILHRDIKPENIGFDIRDDIKIFDFGLAREMLPDERLSDGTYNFSLTGTLRYLAPECLLGHSYNERADVYAYTLVLWEMLALERPFADSQSMKEEAAAVDKDLEQHHVDLVCVKHHRPPLNSSWSPVIQKVLQGGWEPSLQKRLGMEQITTLLREEVIRLRDGDSSGLGDTRRRSTYVFESSGRADESMREIAMLAASSVGSERSFYSDSAASETKHSRRNRSLTSRGSSM